jgi:hypothetical protein
MNLTSEYLKTVLHYDPHTGVFTNRTYRSSRARIGMTSGALDKDGYRIIVIHYIHHKAHRLAFLYMDGVMPCDQVDHINRKEDDNRWVNLRAVDNQVNHMNMPMLRNNRSGVNGVTWDSVNGKWKAQVTVRKRQRWIGRFDNLFDAAAARISAQNRLGFSDRHGR